jgi:hypothetical protein
MKTDSDESNAFSVIMKYLEIGMAIVYIIVGALIVWRSAELNISNQYSLPLGSMLGVYGMFRVYRVYQKYFKK